MNQTENLKNKNRSDERIFGNNLLHVQFRYKRLQSSSSITNKRFITLGSYHNPNPIPNPNPNPDPNPNSTTSTNYTTSTNSTNSSLCNTLPLSRCRIITLQVVVKLGYRPPITFFIKCCCCCLIFFIHRSVAETCQLPQNYKFKTNRKILKNF